MPEHKLEIMPTDNPGVTKVMLDGVEIGDALLGISVQLTPLGNYISLFLAGGHKLQVAGEFLASVFVRPAES